MKFYLTYFYNIRFLSVLTIPISTAKWDPKWFHDNKGSDYVFIDKRGVYNGIRMPELSPYKLEHVECSKSCMQDPMSCSFLKDYKNYLDSLDFDEVMGKITHLAELFKQQNKLNRLPNICLLVHEKPDNPCSERKPLMDWFKEHGVDLEEFKA